MFAKKPPIKLYKKQRLVLEDITARRNNSQALVFRAQIILLWADGMGVRETARQVGIDKQTVMTWRNRFKNAVTAWGESSKKWLQADHSRKIKDVLSDAPRSGAPSKFSAEQVCHIIRIACQRPAESGVPVSHWSASDLQREIIKQEIVEGISVRQVGRFLKQRTSSPINRATG